MKSLVIRLHAYEPDGGSLGFLPQPSSFDASFVHDDTGALQLEYSRKAVNGSILERKLEQGLEIGLEVSDGGKWVEPLNGRFVLISRSRDALDSSDTVKFTCPSYGWLLNKALMLDLSHLEANGDDKGKRVFRKATPGTIMRTFLDENRSRGGIPVSCGFDTGRDAGNANWKSVMTLSYEPGVSALTALGNLADNKICDWAFDKRTLKLYNLDSPSLCRDLSGTVIHLSPDVLEAPEEESIEELASHVLIQGDNSKAFTRDNPAAPYPWGKWELYLSQQGISDKDTAALYSQSMLETAARVRGQYTRTVRVNDVPALPLIDYHPGDWITAPTVRHGERVRVQQVTASLDSDGFKATVVLNDKVYDRTVRQAKRINGIVGGAINGGTGGGLPAPEKDHRVPKAPAGLVVATDAYISSSGLALGLASLKWGAVTRATDNTVIDIDRYIVSYRKSIAGAPWQYVAEVHQDMTAAVGGLECGVRYEFRVRAVPKYSDRWGDWSPTVVALVASDVTPPSVPSKPILTSKLGVVSVRWDGRNGAGGGMELDFDHCEVGISASNGAWQYRDRVAGDGYCYVTGLELNSTWFFALRSVDHSGNKSQWSEGASVKVAPAVTQEDLNASAADILSKAHEDAAKQVAVTDRKVAENAAAIQANKTEAEKADAAIRADLKATQDAVKKNTDANTAQSQQIAKTQSDLADASKKIDANTAGLDKVREHQTQVDATVSQAQSDIKAATSTAQKALDKANSVGVSVDGLHQVFTGPDDPATLDGVTVKDGDLWNRTQRYWTRWQGEANNSVSLLADFYTYWEGEANASPSVLVPLSTRVIETLKFDGASKHWLTLVNADVETVKQSLKDNEKALAEADKTLAQANKDLTQAKADIAQANKDLGQAKTDITANKTALAEANKQIEAANKQITANKSALDKANADITAASKTIASNTSAIEKNRQDITATASTAQKALDAANSVGKSLDGVHNIFAGPDDPTTLKDAAVKQGDLWYKTQKYWTTWSGEKNNSTSLLADFYTYWEGEENNSPSVLVPLSSRIVDVLVYDGTRWNELNLVAANILATGSVVADNIAANAVTAIKIAANSITSDKIVAAAITAGKLAAQSVLADKIAANAVTSDKIVANAITAAKIAANSILADKIAANAVTTEKLSALAVTAAKIAVGAITADKLAANSVTADKIAANAVTAQKIAAKSIQAYHLTANSVTADAIAALTISGDKIKGNAITGDKIAAGSITADKIKGNLLSGTTVEGGVFRTLNGRLVINDTGLKLLDAKGAATLTALTADGSVTLKGALTSGSTVSGATIKGGVIEGTEIRGVKSDGTRYLTLNASGLTMGDKLSYDSAKAQLTLSGTIKASTVTGSTITTTNGRMTWNDTGLVLKDAAGNPTLTMRTADGSITMKGALTSGSTLSGVTVTGSVIQTSAAEKRGVKLTTGGLVGYDQSGNAKFTLDVNGNLKMDGGILANGTLTAPTVTAGVMTSTVINAPLIQSTTADNTGWKLKANALDMWDSKKNHTVHLDGEGGNNLLTGTFQTGLTGNRVKISPHFSQIETAGSDKLEGAGIQFYHGTTAAQHPYIAVESTTQEEGEVSALTFNGGQRVDGDPGAFGRIGERKATDNKTKIGTVYMQATRQYKTPSQGGARINLVASAGGNVHTYASMSAYDANGEVGVQADINDGYLYLGGFIGGWTGGRSGIQITNWEILSDGAAAGQTGTVKWALTPAKYGIYHTVFDMVSSYSELNAHTASDGMAAEAYATFWNGAATASPKSWCNGVAYLYKPQ